MTRTTVTVTRQREERDEERHCVGEWLPEFLVEKDEKRNETMKNKTTLTKNSFWLEEKKIPHLNYKRLQCLECLFESSPSLSLLLFCLFHRMEYLLNPMASLDVLRKDKTKKTQWTADRNFLMRILSINTRTRELSSIMFFSWSPAMHSFLWLSFIISLYRDHLLCERCVLIISLTCACSSVCSISCFRSSFICISFGTFSKFTFHI